jgi:hypothetical protein
MRASMKPGAKLRGFFHYLAVLARDQARSESCEPVLLRAKTRNVGDAHLVVGAADPGRDLPADVWSDLADRCGGKRHLVLSFQLRDPASYPPAPAPCRAFLLTPGVVERLCGGEAVCSAEMARKGLLRLFAGQGTGEPFETARILAAVPELEGEVDETGFCKFRAVELPEQALAVDGLPEHTTVAIVIDRPGHD